MSNNYNGSRSPVRAISSASQAAWSAAAPRPRVWGGPAVHAATEPTPFPAPVSDHNALACPECGSMVRLALLPANGWAQQQSGPVAPQPATDDGLAPDFEESVVRFKRELICRALEEHDGVMTRAAKALGLKYTTFVAMVHRLDLAPDGDGDEAND